MSSSRWLSPSGALSKWLQCGFPGRMLNRLSVQSAPTIMVGHFMLVLYTDAGEEVVMGRKMTAWIAG